MNPTAKCPTADNERRTPEWLIESARQVLGTIDLDPASDESGNLRVKAVDYFDKEDDGLNQLWLGSVFLNPPGGRLDAETFKPTSRPQNAVSSAAVWWSKLLHEITEGRCTEAIYICFNLEAMLNTQKFAPLPIQAFTFCVPAKRVEYPSVNGGNSSSPAGASAIVYVGNNPEKFRSEFKNYGHVQKGLSLAEFLEEIEKCTDRS